MGYWINRVPNFIGDCEENSSRIANPRHQTFLFVLVRKNESSRIVWGGGSSRIANPRHQKLGTANSEGASNFKLI
jgi:hypothetical protein